MLLGINLLLLGKVNAARHNLLLLVVKVNAARDNLQLLVNVNAVEAKPAESEGFEQVVDFLNASSIRYALTVNITIYTSCIKHFWSTAKAKTVNGEVQLQALVDRKKIIITEATKVFANMKRQRKDFSGRVTPLFSTMMVQAQQEQGEENVADEAAYEERDDSLERATTTAIGLDVEQDRGNISKTQSKATPNEPTSIGTSSGSGPRRQDTMRDTIAQTRSENVSKFSNDPLLVGVNIPRGGEDSLQLKELIEFCTKLKQRVLDLENIKIAQAQEITSLKKRVKNLERKNQSRTHGLKRLYKGRKIHNIDADEDITLENVHDADMFRVHDLDGDEVFVEIKEPVVNAATTTSTILVSAAKDLFDVDMTLAQALAELKSTKPKAVKTTATTTITVVTRPKAKRLVIQEQEQASTPITSSKDKGKGIMVEEPLQVEEQEELTIEEKSKLFQQLLEKRRNHFAAKRAEERRNRPPTKAQQRSIMVNTFVDMDTKLVGGSKVKEEGSETREESSSKRAGDELEQETSKKQKMDDDKEPEELKQCMEIISDDGDDVTIKATPLSTKSPTIMLKNFDREDLEVLWSIVKARFKKTDPVNYMDIFLYLNLKTMFEHHLKDNNILYYLLVEKMYPLTKHTLHQMFNDVKLQVDYECKMAFELLILVKKQLKEGYGRIVGIKSLLEVTAVKLLLLVLKVNATGIKVTTAERLHLLKG
ncbi:hypothetical protein Tco_1162942 [Tanacetum coccineum]